MTQFAVGGAVYIDAVLVESHLDYLSDVGYITYHQESSPIPNTISKTLLGEYCEHLNKLAEDGISFDTHELCTPVGNYFMIYRSDENRFEKSYKDGKKALKDQSDQDADRSDTRRDW